MGILDGKGEEGKVVDPGDARDSNVLCSNALKPGDCNLIGDTSGERKPNPNRLVRVGEAEGRLTREGRSGE